MIIVKLALKNIIGAGLKTWLNVFVLSLTFVIIIWNKGIYEGMQTQMESAMIDTELAGGQVWHSAYDPFDPISLEDSHAQLSDELKNLVSSGEGTPILISSGTIFPEGRMHPVLIKGIDPKQKIVSLPSDKLSSDDSEEITAIIGARTAESTNLKEGDYITVRWRDQNGTFDAIDIRVASVFNSTVPTVDAGQIWVSLKSLQTMLNAPGEATLVVLAKHTDVTINDSEIWVKRDLDYLLKDVRDMVLTKKVGGFIFHLILFSIALLAIFDTQVLSIFKRRKEMGTMMALGMTRSDLIKLFTIEGSMHGVLAILLGAAYGIPIMYLSATLGFKMPESASQTGFAIGNYLYPTYSASLIISTLAILFVVILIVSYIPARKISKLKPTDALRGRIS